MPELPEVECLRRSLEPHLVGRTVARATLRRADIHESYGGKGRGSRFDLLQGCTIDRIDRRGKQLAIITKDGPGLCVHLGMTGQLLFTPSEQRPAAHTHAIWTLEQGGRPAGTLAFRDPRRFGGLWSFPSAQVIIEHRWGDLGPDALSVTTDQLAAALSGVHRHVKAALLDQGLLAGVGNIYADEALFVAGIRPKRPAHALKPVQIDALASAIRQVLARSIETGGSTLRDYVDANGRAGMSQLSHAVYGRAGEPCLRCGKPLKTAQVAQRTTVWCSSCQQ